MLRLHLRELEHRNTTQAHWVFFSHLKILLICCYHITTRQKSNIFQAKNLRHRCLFHKRHQALQFDMWDSELTDATTITTSWEILLFQNNVPSEFLEPPHRSYVCQLAS